jgi:glycerophosphoryl diester phosphodiesterase
MPTKLDIQGHRGCRGLMPENTIPAMIKAVELGVTTLEMDVVITKDKKVILSHDPFFSSDITTKPDGSYISENEERHFNIYEMTYAEVASFDVGLKAHPGFPEQQKMQAVKPLLAQVIDAAEAKARALKKSPPCYNIETKSNASTDNVFHPSPGEFVDLLVAVIDEKQITERVTIQSFDIRTLQYLYSKRPGISTALLVEDYDDKPYVQQLQELGFKPTSYSPHYSHVTKDLIAECKKEGVKVIPWTANSKSTILKLIEIGVDGIITDYPNLLTQEYQ